MPIAYPGNSITKEARAKVGGGLESAGSMLSIMGRRVNATGTAATNIVSLS